MYRRLSAAVRSSLTGLLALAIVLTGLTPTSVARATTPAVAAPSASGALVLENLDRVPYNDRLVFQRINSSGLPTHKQVTLRIINSATTPLIIYSLTISGDDSAWFTIAPADAAGFTVAAGAFRDLVVKFVAGPDATTKSLREAALLIASSDPSSPTTLVELAGFNMAFSGGNNEPNFQQVLDTFGYRSLILNPGEAQTLRGAQVNGTFVPGAYAAVGDEVLSAQWMRADPTSPVYVRQLAALSGGGSVPIKITGSGGGIIAHGLREFQSFLPVSTTANKPTELTLNPSSAGFEVVISGYSSDRGAAGSTHAVRFWPVRDREGKLVPNSYIVGQDYVGSSATNYDYQDNVYLITNIRPKDTAADPNKPDLAPGSAGLVLEFDKIYAGTLNDKDNQGLGFPETQRNKNDVSFPQNGPSSSYDKTRLDLVPTGQGTLSVRTTDGSNAEANNTLVNGLCLPFDARSGRFIIATRLIGPLNTLSSPFQQAGLMFGPNQGNFLKLTAGTQIEGATSGKPWLEFAQELNNIATPIGSLLAIPAPELIATLDLQLTAEQATGEVRASYRINDGIFVQLPTSLTLSEVDRGRFFDPQAKGCVLAQNRNATSVDVTFDRFAITQAPPIVSGLPTVSAGPDQAVIAGASVTLSGTALDADGVALTGTWQQVGGSAAVALSGNDNSRSFTVPASYNELIFAFSATDSQGRSAVDTVTVIAGAEPISDLRINPNNPVAVGATMRLSTSMSGGALPISYLWDFGDGSAPVVGGPAIYHTYAALGNYLVTVVASNAAGSVSASSTIVVQTPVPDFALRYDAGSTKDVTTGGLLWKSDVGLFTPAKSPAEKRGDGVPPIANTTDDILYQSYRGKDTSEAKTITYDIPLNTQLGLPAGTEVQVNLRLHFAELYWGGTTPGAGPAGTGRRVFNIIVEGKEIIHAFSITVAAAKAETAVIVPINNVRVTDGKLTLSLKALSDYAAISAFEVLRTPDSTLENSPPTVFAGDDQTALVNSPVVITGSGSDPESAPLSFSWAQVQNGAPSVTLESDGAQLSFTPSAPGVYLFTLSATDSGGLSASDDVSITVSDTGTPTNRAPSANAGPDHVVTIGSSVVLTGSSSDPDGDALSVSWAQNPSDAPMVMLEGSDTVRSFTPPAIGAYLFTFTAIDPGGLTAADTVVVNVVESSSTNQTPTADAGSDQTVALGSAVQLVGSASDPESGPLSYAWLQTSGPTAEISGEGLVRSFTPTEPGTYVFSLIVTDDGGLSSADTVVINVLENRTPSAQAGPNQVVQVGTQVTLDGTASSDPEGDSLSYSWSQIGGPTVAFEGIDSSQPSFDAPAEAAVLVFQLIVTDSAGKMGTDQVQITVLTDAAPSAQAGPDQVVQVGTQVTLDGTASSDPEGGALSYSWSQIDGPPATLVGTTGAQLTFSAPTSGGVLIFRLIVTDSAGITGVDEVQVTVVDEPVPTAETRVYLPLVQ